MTSRGYCKKSSNNGHVSHRSKSLMMTMLLLKTTRYKMNFIAFKSSIRASLDLIDPFTSDRTNMRWQWYKIPSTSTLKCSKLFCHHMLPFLMNINILMRTRFSENSSNISIATIAILWTNRN
uniref:Uncharacterized protein n=1 Tax=Oryza sativa subsp. japonica TaxID=39947 RepID=Q2QR75_ORYSJ|nr:hypothetical protein LOC_Os12g28540 [Oryza sativa Japonica Group]